jgi:NADH-quinone oxidoreductase subunit M
MMLLSIFLVPLVASLIVLASPRRANWISTCALLLSSIIVIVAYARGDSGSTLEDFWLIQFKSDWFHFGLDGLSFVLLVSAEMMAAFALTTVVDKSKEQAFLLGTLAGLLGLLLAVDMLAFFVFWELMLLPVYFWVLAAGREGKMFPALQFIIFTQASGLLLLASVVAIFVLSGTTDPNQMSLDHIGPGAQQVSNLSFSYLDASFVCRSAAGGDYFRPIA